MKAVFLDRDGTLIDEREYLKDPDQIVFLPHAISALKRLGAVGYLLILITNQSGVGRGYFTEEAMHQVHAAIRDVLQRHGVELAAIYAATEAPDQASAVRKPAPGFLFQARDAFGIDLAESYMIGDKISDLDCGRRAGVKASFLVRTGYGLHTEQQLSDKGRGQIQVFDHMGQVADYLKA